MRHSATVLAVALAVAALGAPGRPAVAEEGAAKPPALAEELSGLSGDPNRPRHHFRVRDPARLSPEQAKAVYDDIAGDMRAAYRMAGYPPADAVGRWRRYNRTPFLSATHGRRYINHYANERAKDYGLYERAGRMPVGAVIAKDSFAVTEGGAVHPGPLFVMEKMADGFNHASGDWRYTMIMPDGSLFGQTNGFNAEGVAYCIGCHLAVEHQDHLYFPPSGQRVRF